MNHPLNPAIMRWRNRGADSGYYSYPEAIQNSSSLNTVGFSKLANLPEVQKAEIQCAIPRYSA